jgi:hypothetical protein
MNWWWRALEYLKFFAGGHGCNAASGTVNAYESRLRWSPYRDNLGNFQGAAKLSEGGCDSRATGEGVTAESGSAQSTARDYGDWRHSMRRRLNAAMDNYRKGWMRWRPKHEREGEDSGRINVTATDLG